MKSIAFFESAGKADALKWAIYAAKKLEEYNINCLVDETLARKFPKDMRSKLTVCTVEEIKKQADMIMSFGGDGTMLAAARLMINSNIPIAGVNVGKLGFLAEFPTDKLDESIKDIINGQYRIVDRTILETDVNDETIYALNDFVIEKKGSSKMITLEAYTNNVYIGDYRADGLILTTPTGSSAYSLSCGGPIIAPNTEVLCLTPISPHTLTLRPLVVPDSNEIKLKLYSPTGNASLVADGQTERILHNGEEVIFRRSESKAKIIKPIETTYYSVLRQKLLWATHTIDMKAIDNGS